MRHAKRAQLAAFLAWSLALPGFLSGQATTTGTAPTISTLPPVIPILPMADVVLFPAVSVTLHVQEPRYRAMVTDAQNSERIVGIVLLRPETDPDFGKAPAPSIFPIGCAGVITDVQAVADGGYDIVLQAVAKFRITREETGRPYRVARVTAMPETLRADEQSALQTERRKLEMLMAASSGRIGAAASAGGSDDAFVNGVAQRGDIDPVDRQQLLEQAGPLARARLLIDLLEKTAR
jgi:Lon protease-like protein